MSRDTQSGAGMAAPGIGGSADFSTPQKNGPKFNLSQARVTPTPENKALHHACLMSSVAAAAASGP